MTEGNKRYLGDVWINKENLNRQREFFKSIIDTYQYKNGGSFDAATLQGYVPEDFATAQQGILADNSFQKPLYLGKTLINDDGQRQYFRTDAVLVDDESCLANLPWYENSEMDLSQSLCAMYNDITNALDTKLDITRFDNFYDNDYSKLKNSIQGCFETFIDQDGHEVTMVNADLINGLRLRLITQTAYDNLSIEQKQYWRNVFIIKEDGAIPADYVDPMTWELSDGYTFRIYDHELQVNNGLSDEWKTICSLEDFILGTDLESVVTALIANMEIDINKQSLINALKEITGTEIEDQWRQFPFISSSLRDDYVFNIQLNNSSTGITSSVDSPNGLKTVNIDTSSITNPINSALAQKQNSIDSLQTQITTVNGKLPGIGSRIDGVEQTNNSQDTEIANLNRELDELRNNLTGLTNEFITFTNTLKDWDSVPHVSFINDKSQVYYNEALGIAYAQVQITVKHKKKNADSYVKLGNLPLNMKPVQGIKCSSSPQTMVYFRYDGVVYYRSSIEKDKDIDILAAASFIYKK